MGTSDAGQRAQRCFSTEDDQAENAWHRKVHCHDETSISERRQSMAKATQNEPQPDPSSFRAFERQRLAILLQPPSLDKIGTA